MILADTSVWVEHLRRGDRQLAAALDAGEIWMHPFVLGELACGNLKKRRTLLDLLAQLPTVTVATDAEALGFIETRSLMGRGIGWIDVHLLAAVTLSAPVRLWTRDRRLGTAAGELGLSIL